MAAWSWCAMSDRARDLQPHHPTQDMEFIFFILAITLSTNAKRDLTSHQLQAQLRLQQNTVFVWCGGGVGNSDSVFVRNRACF
jgi:hypothetical protein